MESVGFGLLPAVPRESNSAVTDGRGHWDKLGQQETTEHPYLRILRTRGHPSARNSKAALL